VLLQIAVNEVQFLHLLFHFGVRLFLLFLLWRLLALLVLLHEDEHSNDSEDRRQSNDNKNLEASDILHEKHEIGETFRIYIH